MSHYIPTFLYEPIARQARRFSSPALAEPTEPGSAYHGTDDSEGVDSKRAEEKRDSPMMSSGDESGVFPDIEPTVLPSPMVEDDALDETPGPLGPWTGIFSANESHPILNDQNLRGSGPPGTGDAISSPPDHGTGNQASNPLRDRNQSTNSRSDSLQEVVLALNGGSGRSRRNTEQDSMLSNTGSFPVNTGDGILPEDDGMGIIRKQIIRIQGMDTTNSEKSRRMHELMTRRYSSYHPALFAHQARTHSPSSLQGPDRPFTPYSGHSHSDVMHSSPLATSVSSIAELELVCRVAAEDLVPTYWVPPKPSLATELVNCSIDDDAHNEQDRPLGCAHYKRNVKLQCSACYRWYTCRFCHDAVEDHSLNRRETKNMLCMLCGCPQPAAEECRDCGERGAWYYCGVCKLWDDDPQKYIYHCNDCGICRVGKGLGKDFYHCQTCCVCLAISIRDTHRCIERSTDCDCPICGEYMFTSQQTVVFMRCGHSIHLSCYNEHIRNSYKCPICSRSMMNMEMQFRHLDRAIESQPMPEQFRDTTAWVYCNDCSAKTEVKYHWLGLKCAVCDSYNTAQISITSVPRVNPEEAASHAAGAQLPDSVNMILPDAVQAFARGRPRGPANSLHRSATANPEMETGPTRPSLSRRATRSASARVLTPAAAVSETTNIEYDSAEDEDDVDFWGGESPRDKSLLENAKADVDDSEEDDDEDEDADMDDGMDDEEEEDDHMELFGHR